MDRNDKRSNMAGDGDRARRLRNYALAGLLFFLVILFFVMTIVRLGDFVSGVK